MNRKKLNHIWNPPPPSLIKGIGFGPSKNCVTLGGTKFFARKGGEDKPEKGGGVDVEMGG